MNWAPYLSLETIHHIEKDLGINVDDEHSYEEHVQILTKQVKKLVGIVRTFININGVTSALSRLDKATILWKLYYCLAPKVEEQIKHPKQSNMLGLQNWSQA